jgi:hypothetical protein
LNWAYRERGGAWLVPGVCAGPCRLATRSGRPCAKTKTERPSTGSKRQGLSPGTVRVVVQERWGIAGSGSRSDTARITPIPAGITQPRQLRAERGNARREGPSLSPVFPFEGQSRRPAAAAAASAAAAGTSRPGPGNHGASVPGWGCGHGGTVSPLTFVRARACSGPVSSASRSSRADLMK